MNAYVTRYFMLIHESKIAIRNPEIPPTEFEMFYGAFIAVHETSFLYQK